MADIADLEIRLKHRLGLSNTVELGDNRLTEAMNAGIARAYADGVAGLANRVIMGKTLGNTSSTAVVSHTAGSGIVGVTSIDGVYPGDIFTVGSDSYIIYDAYSDASNDLFVDLGVEIAGSLVAGTGSNYVIHRRSIALPSAGTIYYVTTPTTKIRLEPHTNVLAEFPATTGAAKYYVPGYSEGKEKSYINLVPAPPLNTVVAIQFHSYKERLENLEVLDIPEAALDAILERARVAYLSWSGEIGQVEAALAQEGKKDTENQVRSVGSERSARVSMKGGQ